MNHQSLTVSAFILIAALSTCGGEMNCHQVMTCVISNRFCLLCDMGRSNNTRGCRMMVYGATLVGGKKCIRNFSSVQYESMVDETTNESTKFCSADVNGTELPAGSYLFRMELFEQFEESIELVEISRVVRHSFKELTVQRKASKMDVSHIKRESAKGVSIDPDCFPGENCTCYRNEMVSTLWSYIDEVGVTQDLTTAIAGHSNVYHIPADIEYEVFCRGIDQNNKYTVSQSVPIYAYGPTKVTLKADAVVKQCLGQDTMEILCKVAKQDVHGKPIFSLYQDDQLVTIPPDEEDFDESYCVTWEDFSVTSSTTLRCEAVNHRDDSLLATAEQRITYFAPPTSKPDISFQSGTQKPIMNSTHDVVLKYGLVYDVTCVVHGGSPSVFNYSLTCPHELGVKTGASIITRPIGTVHGYHDEKWCTCVAEHESGCYIDNQSELLMRVPFGPWEVFMTKPASPTVYLCKKLEIVNVVCSVNQNDISDRPLFRILHDNRDLRVPTDLHNPNLYKAETNVTTNKLESFNITCQATNKEFLALKATVTRIIHVRKPPTDPPILEAKGQMPDGSWQTYAMDGQPAKFSCRVPEVETSEISSQAMISCENGTLSRGYFQFDAVHKSDEPIRCHCSVHYKYGCYKQQARKEFSVYDVPLWFGLSWKIWVVVGTLAVMAVFVLINLILYMYCCKRKHVKAATGIRSISSFLSKRSSSILAHQKTGNLKNRRDSNSTDTSNEKSGPSSDPVINKLNSPKRTHSTDMIESIEMDRSTSGHPF